jgi:hypothetical protein
MRLDVPCSIVHLSFPSRQLLLLFARADILREGYQFSLIAALCSTFATSCWTINRVDGLSALIFLSIIFFLAFGDIPGSPMPFTTTASCTISAVQDASKGRALGGTVSAKLIYSCLATYGPACASLLQTILNPRHGCFDATFPRKELNSN